MAQYLHLDTVGNVVNRTGCSRDIAQQICDLVGGTLDPDSYISVKNAGDVTPEEKVLLAINELLDAEGVCGLQHEGKLLAMFVERDGDRRWTFLYDCQRKEWLNTTVAAFEKHGGYEAVQLRRIPPDAMIRIGGEEDNR